MNQLPQDGCSPSYLKSRLFGDRRGEDRAPGAASVLGFVNCHIEQVGIIFSFFSLIILQKKMSLRAYIIL